jgi:predicted glycoside hydrolase/deacetylase ChbG (UPF0249 family)
MQTGIDDDTAGLAGRLGHQAGDRLLLITCDDLGASHAGNLAIHASLAAGVATGASLMVPCPWAREAASLCAGFPIGVHLTLTSEFAGYRWRGLTAGHSLHDADGFLHAGQAAAIAAITAAEAMKECSAQIETALSWGVDVTHLDVHMDVLMLRNDLFDAYLDLALAYRLPIRSGEGALRDRARARGIVTPDRLLYPWPRPARDVLIEALETLPSGVTEIFAHPVRPSAELDGYDPRFAGLRMADASGMTDAALPERLAQHGVQRISQRELRALQRRDG